MKKLSIYALLALAVCTSRTEMAGVGIASPYMPAVFHTSMGREQGGTLSRKGGLQIVATPYASNAENAFDADGVKVPLGDRLGRLSMIGLLQNHAASGYDFSDADVDSPTFLHTAYRQIAAAESTAVTSVLNAPESLPARNDQSVGYYSTLLSSKQVGLHLSFFYDLGGGVSCGIYTGVFQSSFRTPGMLPNPVLDPTSGGLNKKSPLTGVESKIDQYLMQQTDLTEARKMLGVSWNEAVRSQIEDTRIEVRWERSHPLVDADGVEVVSIVPHVAASITLPFSARTGEPSQINGSHVRRIFDYALGNDGFFACTGDLGAVLHFPGMLSCGGGVRCTVYDEQVRGVTPVPTSEGQSVLYPWTTEVTRQQAPLWEFYATFKSVNFIDFVSCYAQYSYLTHGEDTVRVTAANPSLFIPARLERDSVYQAQTIHFALEYEIAPGLRIGGAAQTCFYGKNVANQTAYGASVRFLF